MRSYKDPISLPINFDFISEKAPCHKFLTQQYTNDDPPDDVKKFAIDHSSSEFGCTAPNLIIPNIIVTCPMKSNNSISHKNVSENKFKNKYRY